MSGAVFSKMMKNALLLLRCTVDLFQPQVLSVPIIAMLKIKHISRTRVGSKLFGNDFGFLCFSIISKGSFSSQQIQRSLQSNSPSRACILTVNLTFKSSGSENS